MANKYLFASLSLFATREGDEATSPSFAIHCTQLRLLMRCWKHSLQLSTLTRDAKGSTSPMANNGLFADLLLIVIREGDEAMSPFLKTRCALIDAFSASLEALIAAWYMQRG